MSESFEVQAQVRVDEGKGASRRCVDLKEKCLVSFTAVKPQPLASA